MNQRGWFRKLNTQPTVFYLFPLSLSLSLSLSNKNNLTFFEKSRFSYSHFTMVLFSTFLTIFIFTINITEPVRLQNARYKKSTVQTLPEDEMCNWLIDQCPFLRSTVRPVYHVADQVVVTELKLTGVKFLEIVDLDQTFSIQGKFDFTWQLPECAIWNEDLLQDETNLTAEAKKVKVCYIEHIKMWHPLVRFRNSYTDPQGIVKNFNDLLVLKNNGDAVLTSGGIFEAVCPLSFLVTLMF